MRRWTTSEDELARELAADGYTSADIAGELGRPDGSAVRHRFQRLGCGTGNRPRYEPGRRAEVLGLVAAGLSGCAIARRLGVSQQAVNSMLGRLEAEGLVARSGRFRGTRWRVTKLWTDGDDVGKDEAKALAASGLSAGAIADRLGRSKRGVQKWLAEGVT